jgi:hypothetical protein
MSGTLAGLVETTLELHDLSSIPVLYDPYVLETGGMATTALAFFVRTEAPRVVQLYRRSQNDLSYHTSSLTVILSMLTQGTISNAATMAEIREIFLNQALSPVPAERSDAANVLACFPDAAVRARLQDLAAHDPASVMSDADNRRRFFVREAAARALQGPIRYGSLKLVP